MPAVMAGAGTSSILTLVAISIGAVLLGVLFGQLTKRVPHNESGLYALRQARVRGFRRISHRLVLLDHLLGRQRSNRLLMGPVRRRPVRHQQPTVLKFVPLLLVGTLGWFFVTKANFGPFNASCGSLYDAVNLAAGVALFSFIGVECAVFARSSARNVP